MSIFLLLNLVLLELQNKSPFASRGSLTLVNQTNSTQKFQAFLVKTGKK